MTPPPIGTGATEPLVTPIQRGASVRSPLITPLQPHNTGQVARVPVVVQSIQQAGVTQPTGARVSQALDPAVTEAIVAELTLKNLRWNVAEYVIQAPTVSLQTVLPGNSLVLGLFQSTPYQPYGGAVMGAICGMAFGGRLSANVNDATFTVEVDGHSFEFEVAALFGLGPSIYPSAPDFFFIGWDPVRFIYNMRYNPGDVRGVYWTRRASVTVRNTGTTALTITAAKSAVKLYLQ